MGQQGGSGGGGGHWGGGRSRGGMGGRNRVFGGVQFQQGGHGGYMQQSRMRKPNGGIYGNDEVREESLLGNSSK